jgi:D-tyrosyl-tRNA(Tyr) deacylase
MRAVIQRVLSAAVHIDGRQHAAIAQGLLVLVGAEDSDTTDDIAWLSGKIARLRIFPDAADKMNLAVGEIAGAVLVVSQFTLFASTKHGNRPSFLAAAGPERAIPLYEQFLEQLARDLGKPVQSGIFGANMAVSLINDGPVTIIIDSKNRA